MAERRLWKNVLVNFLNSLRPRRFSGDLIGEDLYGNKYYEIPKNNKHRQRPSRYFTPAKKDDFEAEMPAEWTAWLRNRRKHPPTQEEIAESLRIMQQKKEGALMIAEKFNTRPPDPSKDPIGFPSYGNEYEINPGSNMKDDK